MKLTLLLIPLLFLSSCSIDWNDEKDAEIAELEKQVTELKNKNDDELFKKKQECQKKYRDTYADGNRRNYTNINTDVFYSETEATCMVVVDAWDKNTRFFLIADILAMKTLYSFSVDEEWAILSKRGLDGEVLEDIKCSFNRKLLQLNGGSSMYFETQGCQNL